MSKPAHFQSLFSFSYDATFSNFLFVYLFFDDDVKWVNFPVPAGTICCHTEVK